MAKLEEGFLESVNEQLQEKVEARETAEAEANVAPEQGAGEKYPSVVTEDEPEPEPKAKATKK